MHTRSGIDSYAHVGRRHGKRWQLTLSILRQKMSISSGPNTLMTCFPSLLHVGIRPNVPFDFIKLLFMFAPLGVRTYAWPHIS